MNWKAIAPCILALLLLEFTACKKKSEDECPVCPRVTSISPTSGKAYTTLTITGENFADNFQDNIVKINGVSIVSDSILSGSTTQLVVKVPKGCGSGAVTVDVDADLTNSGTPPVFNYIFNYRVSTFAGKADSAGNAAGSLAAMRFDSPFDILCNPNNVLYIRDNTTELRSINLNNNSVANIHYNSGHCGSASDKSIEVDANNVFYFCDRYENRIISFSGAICDSFAGNITAGSTDSTLLRSTFNSPFDIAINKSNTNEFFVADTYNHTIRKISKTTGRVTTVAGNPADGSDLDGPVATARFNQPSSVLAKDGIIYVADRATHKIKKIENGVVSLLAGSTQGSADGTGSLASFNTPVRINFDSDFNILVCDSGNFRIRKVTRTGVVTTLAGGTSGTFDGDGTQAQFRSVSGVCVDAAGNIYVADYSAHTIRKITRE